MNRIAGRWWPAALLPRPDGRQFSLFFVIAVLSFLACLAAIGALAAGRAADGWRQQLVGSATVVVRAQGLESPDAAAARAAETLAGIKGVVEARALEKSEADGLIARFLGPGPIPADLPTPRLVAVDLAAARPATTADLSRALAADGLDATVEDHSLWTAEIMRTGALARYVAFGLLALIVVATGAAVAFATRQGLAARRDLVEVLHLAGATDGFIARLFQARFARMAALAGSAGGAAAALAGAGLHQFGQGQTLAAILPITWTDLAAALPCPFVAALTAAVTAGMTARATLDRTP
ncbi:MAG TPA: ABC transporter permease [Caulobacteraceae bacterium]|nr:ABC transporter permease [Caulobacteraceae bacterium]